MAHCLLLLMPMVVDAKGLNHDELRWLVNHEAAVACMNVDRVVSQINTRKEAALYQDQLKKGGAVPFKHFDPVSVGATCFEIGQANASLSDVKQALTSRDVQTVGQFTRNELNDIQVFVGRVSKLGNYCGAVNIGYSSQAIVGEANDIDYAKLERDVRAVTDNYKCEGDFQLVFE